MPKLIPSELSCAVKILKEFASYTDPEKVLRATAGRLLEGSAPFIIFTGVIGGEKGEYSENLAKFVVDNGFGTVIESAIAANSTGNNVRVYVWNVDYTALRGWLDESKRTSNE